MESNKFLTDLKTFPNQLREGWSIASGINLRKSEGLRRVFLCGMGGSSMQGEMINNILNAERSTSQDIEILRSYNLPSNANSQDLFILDSYSGNTEETLSCYQEVLEKNYNHIVFTSGGNLLELAKTNNSEVFNIPTNIQPRLTTGYTISGTLRILNNLGLAQSFESRLNSTSKILDILMDEEKAKGLASKIKGKLPVVYATDNNFSIARVAKIAFNENAKTQSFWNYFPELNHNEMVGFTNLVTNPIFLILKSKFTNERNHKRIDIFSKIMKEKGLPVEQIEFKVEDFFSELLLGYYFFNHVAYYLAIESDVDPNPVEMVEEFKRLLK